MRKYNKVAFLGDTLIANKLFGIQRFAIEIIKCLDNIDLPYECEVVVPNVNDIHLNLSRIKVVKIGAEGKKGFWWRQTDFARYCAKNEALPVDLTLGLTVFNVGVICIHDCIFEYCPEDFVGKKALLKRKIYLLRAKICIDKAKKILTVSNNSRSDISRYYGVPQENIEVIYNGWQHISRVVPDDRILDKYSLRNTPYFFSLGSILPHKNFHWIECAAKQNPEYLFVVTGANNLRKNNNRFENIKNLIFTGYLSDEEIKSLMENCLAYVHPSLYEGFGIPPLEALASGAKIIISNSSCLPEIYGNAAVYFDPTKYTDINMATLLKEAQKNKNERNILGRYSWEDSSAKLNKSICNIIGLGRSYSKEF